MNKIPLILPQSVRVAIKNVETHLNSKFRGTPVEKQCCKERLCEANISFLFLYKS